MKQYIYYIPTDNSFNLGKPREQTGKTAIAATAVARAKTEAGGK
jgi:hypothetical protein